MPRSPSPPPRWKAFRLHLLLILAAAAVLVAGGIAVAQDRTITAAVSIAQDDLAAGLYTPNQVVQSGRQFFAVSFLPADAHGEGPNGPRSEIRRELWGNFATPFPLSVPFARVDGLDSQSCFACHNTAGTYVPPGELAKTQKPGPVGGAGDFAVALLSFPEEDSDFPERLTHILRAPPRAFGSAYLQELALEMTDDLLAIEETTLEQAKASGQSQTNPLITKGVSFGSITFTCLDPDCDTVARDASAVEGVSPVDLIVRPFQHKGVTATLRSFTKSALDFHHSLQAVEVFGINVDCDDDDLINEMAVDNVNPVFSQNALPVQRSLGNVAALVAFTGMLRPPGRDFSSGGDPEKGEELFKEIGCADCHVPELTTRRRPQFRIELAEPGDGCPTSCGPYGCTSLGSGIEADSAIHPAVKAVTAQRAAEKVAALCPSGFYCIDLTSPGPLPDEFFPRLPANGNRTVTVPLYSDLKRHDLGVFLTQTDPPQPDDVDTPIPNQEWLTSKLWGVADNGPWIHDGRARTLREAIVFHAGELGNDPNSEAHGEVQSYLGLPAADQQAVIDFLETLRIPIP
jgi:hypothetical protein